MAQITTRDIDRGDVPHYLLKEIGEAAGSFRKTLRGKLLDGPEGLRVQLGDDVVPPAVRAGVADGSVTRMLVIGQGTAAVAGRALVEAMGTFAPGADLRTEAHAGDGALRVRPPRRHVRHGRRRREPERARRPTPTAPSTSCGRGAPTVIAIVNRRNSDLTDRADGVLYTSDGRDVEMSVASTKAFYAQIAACYLLAADLAGAIGVGRAEATARAELLGGLRAVPDAMERVMDLRPVIAAAAQDVAPSRRYWAIVGNGGNRIAAEEVRIKLSELCYKAIACDGTEDKKHIDLSSEPLHPGVRSRPAGLERGRRGQGGGDLPGPQGGAGGHRHRRGGALLGRPARDRGAGGPSEAGVHPVGHGGSPVRLRSRLGRRRPGPSPP